MIVDEMMTFRTETGKRVVARPLTQDDAPYLVDIFEHMSPESRYHRFQQTLENLNPKRVWEEAEKIARMEDEQQGGLIAFWARPLQPHIPVAAARYVRLDGDTAEIAISVRDDMQGQGIGTWLLRLTVRQAQQEGLQKLVGNALNSNTAVWQLLEKLGYPFTRKPEGLVSEIEIDLVQNEK
jgi:acetyltransferase